MLSSSRGFLPYSTAYLQELETLNDGPAVGAQPEAEVAVSSAEPLQPSSSSKRPKRSSSSKTKTAAVLACSVQSVNPQVSHIGAFRAVCLSEDGLDFVVATTEPNAVLHWSGFASLTLLRGSLAVDGYELQTGKETSIRRSAWMPAVRLWCHDSPVHRYHTAEGLSYTNTRAKTGAVKLGSNRLSRAAKETLNALDMREVKCCFLLCGVREEDMEWLVRVEDKSPYAPTPAESEADVLCARWSERELLSCRTGVLGVAAALQSRSLSTMTLPLSWHNTIDSLLTEHCRGRSSLPQKPLQTAGSERMREKETAVYPPVVAMVCGAKGSGKSTFTRHLLHRLLSYANAVTGSEQFAQACVIDCDLGQPELSVPGVVSLSLVSSSLLSSLPYNMHTHREDNTPTAVAAAAPVKQKIVSFFLGDITSRHEPEVLYEALQRLREEYLSLQRDFRTRVRAHAQSVAKSVKATVSAQAQPSKALLAANKFSLLEEEEREEDSKKEDGKATFRASSSSKKISSAPTPVPAASAVTAAYALPDGEWQLPLLINTDGNVQYMGAEVLAAVFEVFSPTLLCHLAPLRSALPPVVETLRQRCAAQGARFANLERGREGVSKTTAVDLRALRLLSYFLRFAPPHSLALPPVLQPRNKKESESNSTVIEKEGEAKQEKDKEEETQPMSDDDEEEENVIDTQENMSTTTAFDSETLYLRNATFVGAEQSGAISLSLMQSMRHYAVPFSQLSFNARDGQSPASLLASIVTQLVGVSVFPSESTLCESLNTPFSASLRSVRCRSRRKAGAEFTLRHTSRFVPLSVRAVALVRAVDLERECVILALPAGLNLCSDVDDDEEKSAHHVVLSIAAHLSLPSVSFHGAGFPVYPFNVSEACGEGAVQAKVRASVKRKGSWNQAT